MVVARTISRQANRSHGASWLAAATVIAAESGVMRVPDTLGFLAGSWRLSRSLTDHRAGASGSFTGTARFEAVAGWRELSYLEEGELRFGGHRGPATRRLLWRALPGGPADVRFPDGRRYCLVDLRPGSWDARHPCGRDLYRISYRVLGPDQFQEHWLVRGPAKEYEAAATLTRCGQ